MKCSCGGSLEPGFIPDFGHAATWASIWVPGEISVSKSLVDRLRTGSGVRTNAQEALLVEAHRCGSCGMIQLFATKPVPRGASPA